MYADEPGVWFDEIELDVPTMPLEHMHIDMRDSMVGAAVMMGAVACANDASHLLRRHLSRRKQVLDLDIAPRHVQVVTCFKRRDHIALAFLKPLSIAFPVDTKIIVQKHDRIHPLVNRSDRRSSNLYKRAISTPGKLWPDCPGSGVQLCY